MVSRLRHSALSVVHNTFLVAVIVFNVVGLIVVLLVVRRVVDFQHVAQFGFTALVVVLVSIPLFVILRAFLRWGDDVHSPLGGRATRLLGWTAVLGFLLPMLAANAYRLGDPGLWQEGRVFEAGGGFWVVVAGERVAATAIDFEMETRLTQLVPLGMAMFCAGLFQAYLAVERMSPGLAMRAVFAPWRLIGKGRKRDSHEQLDAYGPWN